MMLTLAGLGREGDVSDQMRWEDTEVMVGGLAGAELGGLALVQVPPSFRSPAVQRPPKPKERPKSNAQ